MKRHLLSLEDLTSKEIEELLSLTAKIKNDKTPSSGRLKGKTIGLLFQKPSNRTRVSFDVGIHQLGGHSLYLGPKEINLGVRETTADVSKTLSRYLDGIVARVNSHKDIKELAKHSSVPVINALSNLYHPCQALTDIYSIKEKLGTLKDVTVAFVGDGNNVCQSLMIACAKIGVHMHVATPENYAPREKVIESAREHGKKSGAKVMLTNDPLKAVKNADVIYADVWVSMGQEEESAERLKDFAGFQVNAELAKHAKKNYIFMHCLPAHRDVEVTSDIIDGPNSIVFDQAENRLHTQKAILIYLFGTLNQQ